MSSKSSKNKAQPYQKLPTSFVDQVALLQSRGLIVPDTAKAEFYLSQLNYYRFAAYCLPFEANHQTHQFTANTRFDDVLNLYVFDRELRLLMLDAIERFEVSLRTQMAYHLSHNHQTAHPHLQADIFHSPLAYGNCITKLAGEVKRSREEYIKHLTQKYEEELPPIWACVELMTMGQLSHWFANIKKRADRQAICQGYGLDERTIESFCKHLTLIRNYSAHHARLWNRDFTVTMALPKTAPTDLLQSFWQLPANDRRLRKLYNGLVMLAYLMDRISGQHHWKQRLVQLTNQHQIDTSKMGFPSDWKTRPIWR